MLALAARADGWNHAYWSGDDTKRFKFALSELHRQLDRIERRHDEVEVSASIACVPGGWHEIQGGFREDEVAVGPPERIAEVIHDFAQAGAQHVILSLSPDPYAEIEPKALEEAARKTRGDLRAGGQAMGEAYIRFALGDPDAYRLMFDLSQPHPDRYPELVRASARARHMS